MKDITHQFCYKMEETEYEKKKIEEMIHFLASKGYRKESICLASLGYEKYGIMKESSYFNEIRDDLSYAEALLQTNSVTHSEYH